MSLTNKLRRFDLIITKISQSNFPTFDTILNYLNAYDCSIVSRTLQRDFNELKTEFKIYIEYDSSKRGYFIEQNTTTENVIQFIKNMSLQANLLDFAVENTKSTAIILKEKHDLKGVEFIPKILSSIQHHLQVEFTYQAFESNKPKKYTLHAYALKEFLGRWYIVGTSPNKTNILKFGVDRIISLTITETKYKTNKAIDLQTYFSRMIGIIDNDAEREIVVLSFTNSQANYIRTLPLHWTQKEILTNENEVRFEYFILTNYELLQKTLSYGSEVKVIKPIALQKAHKQTLKNALVHYK